MRVLILTNFGMGLYKFRRELLETLLDRGHEVFVSLPSGEYVSEIEALGCQIIITDFERRGMNPIEENHLYKTYCKIMQDIRPDKVLTYTIKPNIYGGMAAHKFNIPQIANVTGLGTSIENGGLKSKVILSLYKKGLSKAQMVFFQNQANYQFFRRERIVSDNSKVIPGSGVNLSAHPCEPYPQESNELIFLIIGRIMKDKGIDEILYAAQKIKALYPSVRFQLIGFYDEGYQEIVEQAQQDGIIEFLGEQKDVHSFIKKSHATIHASYHEGMSNVLLETASAGRPVIASDIPGCQETFEPYVSGIPFEVKNAEDLVRAVREFIELPYEKKAAMGKAGRRHIEKHFDRNIIVNQYINQIEEES